MSLETSRPRLLGAWTAATSVRTNHKSRAAAWAQLALALVVGGCTRAGSVTLEPPRVALTIRETALFPETIVYSTIRNRFLVGSFRKGAIFEVDEHGSLSSLVDDPRLCSVLGIALDESRGQLWVVNSDLDSSTKPSEAGPKHLAAVGVYELATGKPLHYVDLAPLTAGNRLLNGIAVDGAGNAYVTDSFAQSIYKVDAQGRASVFLSDAAFAGEGINLNGVVVHPDGYLLVVKKSDGTLFKIPLAAPAAFSRVAVRQTFVGGDGLVLIGKRDLVVIANQTPTAASNAAFSLRSSDGWTSAQVRGVEGLGQVYPTTGVERDGRLFVVHSKLNELIQASAIDKADLRTQAVIERIGRIGR